MKFLYSNRLLSLSLCLASHFITAPLTNQMQVFICFIEASTDLEVVYIYICVCVCVCVCVGDIVEMC